MITKETPDLLDEFGQYARLISRLQHKARTSRTYAEFEDQYGINIRETSVLNATRVLGQLAQGEAFVEKHRVQTENKKPLERKHHLSLDTSPILSFEEQCLVDIVTNNLTLKHATNALPEIRQSGRILAVKQLSHEGKDSGRHTDAHSATDNNVFFTIGVGDHPVTPFLDDAEAEIIVDIKQMREKKPEALQGLWVSPQLLDYQLSRKGPNIRLGNTEFTYHYDWRTMRKTYRYQRANGQIYERTIRHQDEVYASRELDKALAHELVLHLRFIAGTYQQHVLRTVSDTNTPMQDKLLIVSLAMTSIMPSWHYPEAKIPVQFSIDDPAVFIRLRKKLSADEIQQSLGLNGIYSRKPEPTEIKKLKNRILFGAYHFVPSPYTLALKDDAKNYDLIESLSHAGFCLDQRAEVSINYRSYHLSPMQLALQKRDSTLCAKLSRAWRRHTLDPMIQVSVSPPDIKDLECLMLECLMKLENPNIDPDLARLMPQVDHSAEHQTALKTFQTLEQIFPSVKQYALYVLLIAMVNRNQPLCRHLIETSETIDLLTPNFSHTIAPELLMRKILHEAASNGMIDLVEVMVRRGLAKISDTLAAGHYYHTAESRTYVLHTTGGKTVLHSYAEKNNSPLGFTRLVSLGANPLARDDDGHLPTSLVTHKMTRLMGAQESKKYHRYTVNAMITGRTPQGDPIVVLGEKKVEKKPYDEELPKGETPIELMFPGGMKDANDLDHQAAMFKEIKEETGLDLNSPIFKPRINIVIEYKKSGAGDNSYYHHVLYHVDLGETLYHVRLYSRDDLAKLYKVPVSLLTECTMAHPKQRHQLMLRGKKYYVRRSNAIALQQKFTEHVNDPETLEGMLDIEYDGYYMACEAAARGDINTLERLRYHGAPLEPVDYYHEIDVDITPITAAAQQGRLDVLEWLIGHGYRTDYNNAKNIYSAALKHKQITVISYLCDHRINLEGMWSAIGEASQENQLETLRIMLDCLVKNVEEDDSPNKQSELRTEFAYPNGLRAALKHGFKDISERLILDHRLRGKNAHDTIGWEDDNAYSLCLKHRWFDIIFQLTRIDLSRYIRAKDLDIVITKKSHEEYVIKLSHGESEHTLDTFITEYRLTSDAKRLFHLLVLEKLSGYPAGQQGSAPKSQFFKPAYTDFVNYCRKLCQDKAPGQEIALALLGEIATEKKDPLCIEAYNALNPSVAKSVSNAISGFASVFSSLWANHT